jgi:hypothetical protein
VEKPALAAKAPAPEQVKDGAVEQWAPRAAANRESQQAVPEEEEKQAGAQDLALEAAREVAVLEQDWAWRPVEALVLEAAEAGVAAD